MEIRRDSPLLPHRGNLRRESPGDQSTARTTGGFLRSYSSAVELLAFDATTWAAVRRETVRGSKVTRAYPLQLLERDS
jgi:hypothetical protein